MIAKDNEEKRNQIWKIVMTVTTVLIIIIAAFFVIKLFTSNPLEGKWIHEDSDLVLTIKGGGTANLEWPEEFEPARVAVALRYDIEKDMKIFTLQVDPNVIRETAENSKGAVSIADLEASVSTIEGTFDYSIEQKKLTLTDREYGDQMIFDKQ